MKPDIPTRYSMIAIILHWVMAVLILFMIWLGLNMEGHEDRYQLHKSIGITLLILTLARIIWRLYNKPPGLPNDIKPIEVRLSKLVQFGFYGLMLFVPLGGWILVSISSFNVPTVLFDLVSWPHLPLDKNEELYKFTAFIHSQAGSWGFGILLFLHIAGALKHQFTGDSPVLPRIIPNRNAHSAPTKGLAMTIFVALGFFVIVAMVPFFSQLNTGKLNTGEINKSAAKIHTAITPNWEVLDTDNHIKFAFSHDGQDYSGQFTLWTADIEFHPEKLSQSKVRVQIDLTSAQTGKKLYDDSLRAGEWFDIKTNPDAHVSLSNFTQDATGLYTADAILTLKGINVTSPFTFSLKSHEDGLIHISGTTIFNRKSLQLGQTSDPNADWVSELIKVTVELNARQLTSPKN